MPYRICKTIEIENGHMLSKHPDKCRFPHGHTRVVSVLGRVKVAHAQLAPIVDTATPSRWLPTVLSGLW